MVLQNETRLAEAALFSNIYSQDLYMGLAAAFSFINFFVLTPLLYIIIWYEQYGSDHPRTLLNQLVTSLCWNGILHNLISIPAEIALDLCGPLSQNFCSFHFIIKNSLICHLTFMINFIILVKYISIFMLNNPTEILSDLWCFYLNILSFVFSIVSQIVFILLPGINPIGIYICNGLNPREVKPNIIKTNVILQILPIFCFFTYIWLCIKVKILSKKSPVNPFIDPSQNGWKLPSIKDILEKNSLASLGTIGLYILSISPIWIIHHVLRLYTPEVLSFHPFQLIVHFHYHGYRFLCNLLLIILCLSRSAIRRAVIRKITEKKSEVINVVC